MKLYMTPLACSLADHIALNEAGLAFDCVKVDIPTRRTEAGDDFTAVNPKGYVPALVLDDGAVLTENAAILAWVAEQSPALLPDGPLGRVRMVEDLAFVGAEIHKPFIRMMFPASDADAEAARAGIAGRFDYLAGRLEGDYLRGDRFTAADAYLYVMLRWAAMSGIDVPPALAAYRDRVTARPAVRRTLDAEGIA